MVEAAESAVRRRRRRRLGAGQQRPGDGARATCRPRPTRSSRSARSRSTQPLIQSSVNVTAPTPAPAGTTNLDTGAGELRAVAWTASTIGPAAYVRRRLLRSRRSGGRQDVRLPAAGRCQPVRRRLDDREDRADRARRRACACGFSEKVYNAQRAGAIGDADLQLAGRRRHARCDGRRSRTPPTSRSRRCFVRRSNGLAIVDALHRQPGDGTGAVLLQPASGARTRAM